MNKMCDELNAFKVTKESFTEQFMSDNIEKIIRLGRLADNLTTMRAIPKVKDYVPAEGTPEGLQYKKSRQLILELYNYTKLYMAGIGVTVAGNGGYNVDSKERSKARAAASDYRKNKLDAVLAEIESGQKKDRPLNLIP
jgi:hypothetical protein